MCGIAGILRHGSHPVNPEELARMSQDIAHRGPDGKGEWVNAACQVGFTHRRLAIIDLSPAGAQPMHYGGRYTIVYNGEIYNYIGLRQNLAARGHQFSTESDTEVILAAWAEYGIRCPEHLDGMFAFAIWDEQEQCLFAARDRFGEKPFYYSSDKSGFIFASEVNAIRNVSGGNQLSNTRLIHFLALGHTRNADRPSETIYDGIVELPAASTLRFDLLSQQVSVSKYWQIAATGNTKIADEDAIARTRELLEQSVKKRLRSDVPVGTSLSGGLDSSTLYSIISRVSSGPVNSFSAVFPGSKKDESRYIELMRAVTNSRNFSVSPGVQGLIDDLEDLIRHQQCFVSSSSIYAQYCVFRLARQHNITVLLDGQGADEILAGYDSYRHWALQEMLITKDTDFRASLDFIRAADPGFEWDLRNRLAARAPGFTASYLRNREKRKLGNTGLFQKDFYNRYGYPESIPHKPVVHALDDMLLFNTIRSGLPDLLHYADRNSMAFGCEVRLPFLSHELVEFFFSLPLRFKFRNGWSKWLLRKAMEPFLPKEITWRKDKIGYEPPQAEWLQHPDLRERIHEAKKALVGRGILNSSVLNKKIQPLDTHAADNFDWRFLVTDTILRH